MSLNSFFSKRIEKKTGQKATVTNLPKIAHNVEHNAKGVNTTTRHGGYTPKKALTFKEIKLRSDKAWASPKK